MKSLFNAAGLILALSFNLYAEDSKPLGIGDAPPAFDVETLVQAPAGSRATWDSLKGKVVVLECWATWCGPCVAAIPHVNDLADAFKDKPVVFISLSDEDEKTVKEFLEKRPIHGWVGVNPSKSTFRAFGVHGIPHTIVIGADGKIAAITFPNAVEAKHIENVLAGKPSELPLKKEAEALIAQSAEVPVSGDQDPAVFQMTIRPSKAEKHGRSGSTSSKNQNQFGVIFNDLEEGATVADLLPALYGVSGARLSIEADLPEGRFDVLMKGPAAIQRKLVQVKKETLEQMFGLSTQTEKRERDAYVLTKERKADGLRPTAMTNGASSRNQPGKIQSMNVSIDSLVANLEKLLGRPVIDETGLKEKYDIDLKWDQPDKDVPNVEGLVKAVEDQLGLRLAPAKREVDVLVVKRQAAALGAKR